MINIIGNIIGGSKGAGISIPSFSAPANQEIITEDVPYTVRVYAPGNASVDIYDGVTLLGAASHVGGGYWEYAWTPTAPDFDVHLHAVGNVTGDSGEIIVVVDETNQINQTVTAWTKSDANIAITGGQADPDGGSAAYKVSLPVTSGASKFIYQSMASTPTNPQAGIEFWAKPTGSLTVLGVQAFGTDVPGSGYIDLVTGQANTAGIYASIVERRDDGWVRVWFGGVDAINPTNLWFTYIADSLTSNQPNIDASEATGGGSEASITLFQPRTADGTLPFTDYQKLSVYKASEAGGVESWQYVHPMVNTPGDADAAKSEIQVIKPSGWDANASYPILYMLPALANSVEQAGGNSTPAQIAIAGGYANLYGCVVIIPSFRNADEYWYGKKTDLSADHHTFTASILTAYAIDHLAGGTGRENHLLMGYSKSGWAAISLLLRNPTKFGYAASWDGIMDVDWATEGVPFGAAQMFTTEANFNLYDPDQILVANLASVNDKARIVLRGYFQFQTDQTYFKGLLDANSVSCTFNNTLGTEHSWDGGWPNSTVADLFALR